jgi:hypothetical protein
VGGCHYRSYHYIVDSQTMKLHYYKWHSVNILPILSSYSFCKGDGSHDIVGGCIELVLFGWIIVFTYPSKKSKKIWSSGARGPLWSRRRKKFYFVEKT